MTNPKIFSLERQDKNTNNNSYLNFKSIFDKYAPKVNGFFANNTDTKEKADEYLTNVFLRIWNDIKTFDENTEKKIMMIVLLECKNVYKTK